MIPSDSNPTVGSSGSLAVDHSAQHDAAVDEAALHEVNLNDSPAVPKGVAHAHLQATGPIVQQSIVQLNAAIASRDKLLFLQAAYTRSILPVAVDVVLSMMTGTVGLLGACFVAAYKAITSGSKDARKVFTHDLAKGFLPIHKYLEKESMLAQNVAKQLAMKTLSQAPSRPEPAQRRPVSETRSQESSSPSSEVSEEPEIDADAALVARHRVETRPPDQLMQGPSFSTPQDTED